jgi:hypothetical protein
MCLHWHESTIFLYRRLYRLQASTENHQRLSLLNYKAIPSQAWTDPEAPRFQDKRQMKVVRLSAIRIGRLYPPGNIPGTHFCEPIPGPWCGRKDYVYEKFQWHHRESNSRPSGSWRSASTNCATACLLFTELNTWNQSINQSINNCPPLVHQENTKGSKERHKRQRQRKQI